MVSVGVRVSVGVKVKVSVSVKVRVTIMVRVCARGEREGECNMVCSHSSSC